MFLKTIPRLFFLSCGLCLFVAAFSKLISSFGASQALRMAEPISMLPFKQVFRIVGAVELLVAFVCLFGKRIPMQACLVAWLASSFALYRIALLWIGYHKPCNCLGNISEMLHMSTQEADAIMKTMCIYMFIGSYAILFWFWGKERNHNAKHAEVSS